MHRNALYVGYADAGLSSTAVALWACFVATADPEGAKAYTHTDLRSLLGNRKRPGMAGNETLAKALAELLPADETNPEGRGLIARDWVGQSYRYTLTPTHRGELAPGVAEALTDLIVSKRVGAAAKHVAVELARHAGDDRVVRADGLLPSQADLMRWTFHRTHSFPLLDELADAGFIARKEARPSTHPRLPERYLLQLAALSGRSVAETAPRDPIAGAELPCETPQPPTGARTRMAAPVDETATDMAIAIAALDSCRIASSTVVTMLGELQAEGIQFGPAEGGVIAKLAGEVERRATWLIEDEVELHRQVKKWLGGAESALRRDGADGWRRYLLACVRNYEIENVPCPECNAPAREKCAGRGHHTQRVDAALRAREAHPTPVLSIERAFAEAVAS